MLDLIYQLTWQMYMIIMIVFLIVNADLEFPNFAGIKIHIFAVTLVRRRGKTLAFFFSLKR